MTLTVILEDNIRYTVDELVMCDYGGMSCLRGTLEENKEIYFIKNQIKAIIYKEV